MENPYQSPLDDAIAFPGDDTLKEYGGIGRLAYVGYSVLLYLGFAGLVFASMSLEIGALNSVAVIGFLVASVFISAKRLKNMGYTAKWILLMFVPLLNVVMSAMFLICPEGYGDTRKLDTAGKVMTGILFLCIVLSVLVALLDV